MLYPCTVCWSMSQLRVMPGALSPNMTRYENAGQLHNSSNGSTAPEAGWLPAGSANSARVAEQSPGQRSSPGSGSRAGHPATRSSDPAPGTPGLKQDSKEGTKREGDDITHANPPASGRAAANQRRGPATSAAPTSKGPKIKSMTELSA